MLSLAQAARRFKIGRATLDRLRREGRLGEIGAWYDDARGRWQVPASGLARLGYRLREHPGSAPEHPAPGAGTSGPSPAPTPASTPASTPLSEQGRAPLSTPDPDEVRELRERLAHAERRAAVAEAIADERAQNLADLRTTLRLLEARAEPVPPSANATGEPSGSPSAKYTPGADDDDTPAARPARSWLGRLLGR